MSAPLDPTMQRFEDALLARTEETTPYALTLFITGASDRSARAITNARALCDTYLAGRHELQVVDLHEDTDAVTASQVVAAPTLVRHRPLPVRRFVGDLANTSAVLRMLGLPVSRDPAPDD